MQILNTIASMRTERQRLRESGRSLALVPTMGALHAGHLSLVRAAKSSAWAGSHPAVAVSIFVNPTQFGPHEDFSGYPRTLEADCALLEAEEVDFVFTPAVAEMYPHAPSTLVHVGGISERLDGSSRPGHFDGVATVVSKLFHILEPQCAFFGQKDAAQLAVLRTMVHELNFPVELVACPIVREPDGLAMSSRNRYLSAREREQARALSRALRSVESLFSKGEMRTSPLIEAARNVLSTEPELRMDYIAAVNPLNLEPLEVIEESTLFAVAAWVGSTRLIDNIVLSR